MGRDYDSQLLESVAVRRRRLRDAFVLGTLRQRRTVNNNIRRLVGGAAVAAVAAAGCVGWSFLDSRGAF